MQEINSLYDIGQGVCIVLPSSEDAYKGIFEEKRVADVVYCTIYHREVYESDIILTAKGIGGIAEGWREFCTSMNSGPIWYPKTYFSDIIRDDDPEIQYQYQLDPREYRWYDAGWRAYNFRDAHSQVFHPKGSHECGMSKSVQKKQNPRGVLDHWTFLEEGNEEQCPYCSHIERLGPTAPQAPIAYR